jgi:TonB family protein
MFAVGITGEVWDARVEASSLPDAGAQRCALDALNTLRLPPPPNGWLTVRYPLHFSTAPSPHEEP